MKSHPLATVLLKVLGLSLTINGFVGIVNGIINIILWFRMQPLKIISASPNLVWQTLANYGVSGIAHVAIGLFLIIKTSYCVERLLKIKADEEISRA
jgi:hypothetical protein